MQPINVHKLPNSLYFTYVDIIKYTRLGTYLLLVYFTLFWFLVYCVDCWCGDQLFCCCMNMAIFLETKNLVQLLNCYQLCLKWNSKSAYNLLPLHELLKLVTVVKFTNSIWSFVQVHLILSNILLYLRGNIYC